MAEPFMAEIRMMSFNFAPKGWALCNGQLLAIQQNEPICKNADRGREYMPVKLMSIHPLG